MNKVITSTQYNRPEYTKQMLEHLSRCDGVDEYTLVACVDPSENLNSIVSLLKEANFFYEVVINVNERKLGCNTNTLKALYSGIRRSDVILHVEDDIILSRDALTKYEEWAKENNDDFSFSLYSRIEKSIYKPEMINDVLSRQGFIPWGFGIREWGFAKALENKCFNVGYPYVSWDIAIHLMCQYENLNHKFTFLSRAQNIGAENGTHVPNKEWHTEYQLLDFWAGDLE